jgi:hypothetical protein
MTPLTLEQRAANALQRIKAGHAPMRIPADPSDPDLVISELVAERNDLRRRAESAEREAACFRAARLTWPEHVLEAVKRGDKAACEADAKARHDNWERLHARVEVAERGASALRLELEEARLERDEFKRNVADKVAWHHDGVGPDVPVLQPRYDAALAHITELEKQVAELNVEVARVTERAAALLNDGLTKHAALRAVETERDALRAVNDALTQRVAELNVELAEATQRAEAAERSDATYAQAVANDTDRDAAEARRAQLVEAATPLLKKYALTTVDRDGLRDALSATDSRWLDAKLAEAERNGGTRAIERTCAMIHAAHPEMIHVLPATLEQFAAEHDARVYARAIGEAVAALKAEGGGRFEWDGGMDVAVDAVRALLNGKAGA